MVISWYGETCFKIQSGDATIMTDPPAPASGLKQPRFRPDVLILSITQTPIVRSATDNIFSIIGPGEYQVGKLTVRGFFLESESSDKFLKSAYLISDSEISICYLGHMSDKNLPARLIESLSEVDIVILPGGGKPFLEQNAAVTVTNQLEPALVIPSNFKVPGLKRKSDDEHAFLKAFGTNATAVEKLTVKRKDINPAETKVALLKPN